MDAFLQSWPYDPWLAAWCVGLAAVHLCGWLRLRSGRPGRWTIRQPIAFQAGLALVYLALASPIEPFASLLLQMHMMQHVLLMMFAPPLLWLGDPLFPILRGLPRFARKHLLAPFLQSRFLRDWFAQLTHPWFALPVFLGVNLLWHLPRMYELALASEAWHYAQHASFMAAALLYWYPVIRPYPARPKWSVWILIPYLLIADVANTVLSAVFTFSERVLYPHYESVPRLWGIDPITDQAASGVIMWIPGSVAFLVPLFVIGVRLFAPSGSVGACDSQSIASANEPFRGRSHRRTRVFDLLRVPIAGRVIRWSGLRTTLQLTLAIVALIVVVDGFRGPQVGAMNLAGVLPWTHWRGLVVLGLLAAGNVFCFACPFTLPRRLLGSRMHADRKWPRFLQSKWIAVALVVLFLWSYEAFSLWDRPLWTAWIVVGYFAAAFTVDSVFRGSSFCKYVCPIGQFHFVQSLVSPMEVRVRERKVCGECGTADCIRGGAESAGCQLHLFQPKKIGNMDCTFCLDCVRACPHENVGLIAVAPMQSAVADAPRSGVGRFSRRTDLAVLVVVLVFGAFANAAGMIAPVLEWQSDLQQRFGWETLLPITSLYYLLALIVVPVVSIGLATAASRRFVSTAESWTATVNRFVYALVPIGFSMWLAHYSFHFATSFATVVPATQRFSLDIGLSGLGEPAWSSACCQPVGDWLLILECLAMDIGLLVSLYTAWRIGRSMVPRGTSPIGAVLPWGVIILSLFALGIWILFQPMEMRGTMG